MPILVKLTPCAINCRISFVREAIFFSCMEFFSLFRSFAGLCMFFQGCAAAADRLLLPVADGYPGEDDFGHAADMWEGRLLLQCGPCMRGYGNGNVLCLLRCVTVKDPTGHRSGHCVVLRSWMHRDEACTNRKCDTSNMVGWSMFYHDVIRLLLSLAVRLRIRLSHRPLLRRSLISSVVCKRCP